MPDLRRRSLPGLLILTLLGCAAARAPAPPQVPRAGGPATRASRYALEVEAPLAGARSSIPWIEIRGRLGTAELSESDVVLVLDFSNSALLASGIDLDEDGTVGETRRFARDAAVRAAHDLSESGIDLYIFSFGKLDPHTVGFLGEMAQAGAAALIHVDDPMSLLQDLAPVRLAPNWIEIENLSTGEDALAVESSQQGRFVGFLPLRPGANEISVRTELRDGRQVRWQQTVHHEPPAVVTEAHRREAARLLVELRRRTRRLLGQPLLGQPLLDQPGTEALDRAR